MKRMTSLFGILLALTGCSSVEPNPMREYLAMAPAEQNAGKHPKIRHFVELYDNLEVLPIKTKVENTYAEQLYFNDTLVTLHDRQALQSYLEQTQKNLDSISIEVMSVFEQGDDAFVRWNMRTRFTLLGRSKDVTTIGFSHLRFDDHGKIVLHQDYWDSTQGFFLQVPIIGGVLQWIKNGLHD
ncbi:MAG: hypothetical protein CVV06_04160 [Gammaproteobacteria bacterium HGW-Gammaproteobacteria-10]|nr:MAG: hypothetical protein CVV06_04160 [Gammaproteobacteria bacterium HGW-Gammaproteobacteria-10]